MPRNMTHLCNASSSLRALFIGLMIFTNFNKGSYSKDFEIFQVGIIKEICEQYNFTTLDQKVSLTGDKAKLNMIIKEVCIDHETFRDLDYILKNSSFLCIVGDISIEKDQILSSLSPLYNKSYLSPYGASIYRGTSNMFSIGSSSRQMSQALVAILHNLQWQNMLLIVQPSQYWIEFGMTMLLSYTREAFIPTLIYFEDAYNDSSSNFSNTEKILASATSEQKAIILCTDVDASIRILQVAAAMNMASKHAFFHITVSPYIDDGAPIATAEFPQAIEILRNTFIFKAEFPSKNSSRKRRHTNTDSTMFIKDSLSVIYQAILSFNDTSSIDVVRLFKNMQNKTFQGHSGYIVTDHEREVLFDHYLYVYREETGKFQKIGRVARIGTSWSFNLTSEDWYNQTFPVADSCFKRICDTNNKDIDPLLITTISLSVLILVGIIVGVVIFLWRNFGKRELGKGPNKLILTPDDLVFLQRRNQSKGSSKIMNGQVLDKPDLLRASEKPNRSLGSLHEYSDITDLARYNIRNFAGNCKDMTNEEKRTNNKQNKKGVSLYHSKASLYESKVRLYHSVASLYHSEVRLYYLEASLYHSEASLHHSDVSLYHLEASLYHSEVRLYYLEASLYHSEASLYHSDVSLYHLEASLYHSKVSLYHSVASLYHSEVRLYHLEASLYYSDVSLYHLEASLYHLKVSLYHSVASLYHSEVRLYHLEASLYHSDVSLYHLEASLYHSKVSLYHSVASLYHSEVRLYHLEASLYHSEASLYHLEVITQRPQQFPAGRRSFFEFKACLVHEKVIILSHCHHDGSMRKPLPLPHSHLDGHTRKPYLCHILITMDPRGSRTSVPFSSRWIYEKAIPQSHSHYYGSMRKPKPYLCPILITMDPRESHTSVPFSLVWIYKEAVPQFHSHPDVSTLKPYLCPILIMIDPRGTPIQSICSNLDEFTYLPFKNDPGRNTAYISNEMAFLWWLTGTPFTASL
ncbi:hypothetical protein CHS0354_034935 [Potamilus streckersoni]|uniref:Receptor ligand binding region domain-containing protein n=1 Tax=Potamilus streckersoni TaxID=2493646 RepID=A0AAE0VTV3_9BIVA|nr:hypothetical protein CHS0354_034935 [Potamilus streckersoni]